MEPSRDLPAGLDLRLLLLGVGAWAGGLLAALLPGGGPLAWVLLLGLVAGSYGAARAAGGHRGAAGPAVRTWAAVVLVGAAVAGVATLRAVQVDRDPVTSLAREGAAVSATLSVTSDPRLAAGRFSDRVIFRPGCTR